VLDVYALHVPAVVSRGYRGMWVVTQVLKLRNTREEKFCNYLSVNEAPSQ
jgi:hypothetical protein